MRDFWAGIMFIIFGLIFGIYAYSSYTIGTPAKMGPGFFPTALGVILTILGIIVTFNAFMPKNQSLQVEQVRLPVLLYILGAVVLFGLALPYLGFVLSLVILIVVASRASHEASWVATGVSVVVLAIACYLIFIKGLNLPMPVLPKFLSR